jgi:hypothetical protein
MNNDKNSIINSPAPPSIQQTGQSNVNVTNLSGGNVNFIQNPPVEYDENGVPFTPVNHVRFDSQSRIIYLGNEQVTIPIELIQPGLLTPEELPYVNALCDVYAEKLGKAIGDIMPDMIPSLSKNIQRHYSSQRKAYYQAEYVKHVARETFADGDRQFVALKEDAYTGIEDTYFDEDYATGYDRLKAVLDRITTITLTKSALMNVVGLIGNLEKKGICHILVNDERIKS